MTSTSPWLRNAALTTAVALVCVPALPAQQPPAVPPVSASPQSTPAVITLDEAIARARVNEPALAAATAAAQNAKLDQSIARAALLPNVAAENQFLYTQGGPGSSPIR